MCVSFFISHLFIYCRMMMDNSSKLQVDQELWELEICSSLPPIHLYRGKGCCRSTHRNKFIFSGDYCNIIAGMLLNLQQGVSSPKEYVYILNRSIDVKKSRCFKRRVIILKFLNSLNHWFYKVYIYFCF